MWQEMCNDVYCIIEAMVGRSSGLRLAPPCLDGVPPCIIGDPDRLRGILLNLYTNAGAAPCPCWLSALLCMHTGAYLTNAAGDTISC